MSSIVYRLASVALAVGAVAAGFVLIPAAQTHRELQGEDPRVQFAPVLAEQWDLQLAALKGQVRLETRHSSNWQIPGSYLDQLTRDVPGSALDLAVQCDQGQRNVSLLRTRHYREGDTLGTSTLYKQALAGTLAAGWELKEKAGQKSFYGVRQLYSMGWSYRDASQHEDSSESLTNAYPDMALVCPTGAPGEQSLDEALGLIAPEGMTLMQFVPGAEPVAAGLQVMNGYFEKLASVTSSSDVGAGATTLTAQFDYGQDAGTAGAAYLKARSEFATRFGQVRFEHQRRGVGGEATKTTYNLAHGGVLVLSLTKSPKSAWQLTYALTVAHKVAAELTKPLSEETPPVEGDVLASPAAPASGASAPAPAAAPLPKIGAAR